MKNSDDRIKNRLRIKLSADDGFAERPLYSMKAFNTEKSKGIDMAEFIFNNFNISQKDMEEKRQKEIEETRTEIDKRRDFIKQIEKPIKWTRDEKGNIKSPFSKKK